ncbi:MAG: segregation/condensation protein A [Clostridia bacterium]|nr:segregation/condensation protein A [Clostridia bacterium]
MDMRFRLKDFDGPLDLLLHLVTKAQVDIRDIFVSQITEQYIAFVHAAEDLDMDGVSDFLVMAATLLEIKSRALLPRPPRAEEDEEDPEAELIRRLEEYKRFRETAVAMKGFENAARALFTKLPDEFPLPPPEVELVGLTLEGLTEALMRVLSRKPPQEEPPETNRYAPRDIRRDEHTVQECMLTLLRRVRHKPCIRFEEAFSEAPTREEVVTCFLALLELLRLGKMHIAQDEICGEIWVMAGPAETSEGAEEEAPAPRTKRRRGKTAANAEGGAAESETTPTE